MTTTLKNTSVHARNTKLQPTPKMRSEMAELVDESRRLTQRIEVLVEQLGEVTTLRENTQHIPERGRVRVIANVAGAEEVSEKEGVALAGGADANGDWTYTVLIDTLNETYLLPESALQFLGWTVLEPMYDEPAIRVRVDRSGNGSAVRKPRKRGK